MINPETSLAFLIHQINVELIFMKAWKLFYSLMDFQVHKKDIFELIFNFSRKTQNFLLPYWDTSIFFQPFQFTMFVQPILMSTH